MLSLCVYYVLHEKNYVERRERERERERERRPGKIRKLSIVEK